MQRAQARLDGWDRRLSECGRNLYRLHHAGFPRQVNAVHAQAAGISAVVEPDQALRTLDLLAARVHQQDPEQRAEMAA